MTHSPILKPGRNCWRVEHADRLAFLVDGADYFRAFRETAKQARHSLLIIGWDIDSGVALLREHHPGDGVHGGHGGHRQEQEQEPDGLPVNLGDFLNSLLERNNQLHIHILDWDFTMIFTPAREWMPLYKEECTVHPRLHFHQDDQHPAGACHHQKIVVVDDCVAFAGGLDLTRGRWDTSEHRPDDPRRRETETEPVPQPYHDIQMMVSGAVAAALGELARERWRHATGEVLSVTKLSAPQVQPALLGFSCWPDYLAPDLENVQVAITRTVPRHNNQAEVREVQQFLQDAIASARDSIYIEAQYFTASKIGTALAKRLREYDGPEVVVLLPEHSDGWLPRNTMDVLRERVFSQLKKADRHNRLRLYCPDVPGLDGQCLNMHSKMIMIDNELVRVGSANFNNRSMGLDTECNLVLEANGDARIRSAIDAFRNRLLGEHLGVEPGEFGARVAREGSLIRAIESLRGSGRTLHPLTLHVTPNMDALVPDSQIVDPEQPVDADKVIRKFVPEEQHEPAHHIALIVSIIAVILGLAAWHGPPLLEWINADMLVRFATDFEKTPGAPLLALGIFVAGGLVALPLTVLVVVCDLVFGLWHGFLYSLLGAMVSAMVTYALGHFLGRNTVRRFAGKKLNELNRRLARRGLITMIIVRIIPVAPFTIINMVAGAARIRFRDFVIGSAIGLLPGIVGISLFTDRLAATIQKPDLPAFAILAAVAAVIILGGWSFWRWEERRRNTRLRAPID